MNFSPTCPHRPSRTNAAGQAAGGRPPTGPSLELVETTDHLPPLGTPGRMPSIPRSERSGVAILDRVSAPCRGRRSYVPGQFSLQRFLLGVEVQRVEAAATARQRGLENGCCCRSRC